MDTNKNKPEKVIWYTKSDRGKYHKLYRRSQSNPYLIISNCAFGTGFPYSTINDESAMFEDTKCKHCLRGPRQWVVDLDKRSAKEGLILGSL